MTGQGTTPFLTCFYSPFQHEPGTDCVSSGRQEPKGARSTVQASPRDCNASVNRDTQLGLASSGILASNWTRESFYTHRNTATVR